MLTSRHEKGGGVRRELRALRTPAALALGRVDVARPPEAREEALRVRHPAREDRRPRAPRRDPRVRGEGALRLVALTLFLVGLVGF